MEAEPAAETSCC